MNYGTGEYWRATAALSLGSFLVFAIVYLTQPLLPLFVVEFGLSEFMSSLSLSVVVFCISVALLIYGPVSDAVGRKPIMVWCMAGGVVSTVLTAYVSDYSVLLILRAVQGLFLAGLPALAMAYMSEEFSPKALSVSMGLYIAANSLGGMSGRILSGVIAEHWGWRSSFAMIGFLSVALFVAFVFLLPRSRNFKPSPLQWRSAALAMINHLKNPTLSIGMLIGGLHFLVFIGSFNYLTFLLSEEPFHLSPSQLGMLFLAYAAGSLGSAVSGRLSDRWGKSRCMMAGILIFASGLLLTLVGWLPVILIGLVLQCFGFFFSHSASASWVNSRAAFAKASAASLYLFFYYLGGGLGSFYLGWFWHLNRWPGVVGGGMLVFILTFFLTRKLYAEESRSLVRVNGMITTK
ncbi:MULTISPECIES: MFS transporter [unclassified Paenibacillus]|uniref:MFS transporter n=1 Tax=unclassified Paenibacillus TaxID=185978 RepID=UPI002117F96F|nr:MULTISPECIES: MFS transporter [unclassified Paenibacillus]